MNTIITSAALIAAAAMLCQGCGSSRSTAQPAIAGADMIQADIPVAGSQAVMPKARIYRTNGDYRDKVPVNLDAARSTVVSYPAPTDLTALPVQLADGYLLDLRGIGPNTAFTSYTYAEYSAMKDAPTPSQIMDAIMPGARNHRNHRAADDRHRSGRRHRGMQQDHRPRIARMHTHYRNYSSPHIHDNIPINSFYNTTITTTPHWHVNQTDHQSYRSSGNPNACLRVSPDVQ